MSSNWNFPGNGNGQIRGIADAGIETFSGTELQSLAREICQNSLDAVLGDKPVKVEFEDYEIDSNNIPGYEQYVKVIESCKEYWDKAPGEKDKIFLLKAINSIRSSKTHVLRASDYNTKGLSDPYDATSFGTWNSLIKIDGGATKTGDTAGSFGIGKNAPFSNSAYRLVFYRTINEKGEKAAQGVSRLMSFPIKGKSDMASGIGYFGENGNMPSQKIEYLDDINFRNEKGTDVFVYGFSEYDNWQNEMIEELLKGFLMSFYNGKLEVKVQNKTIDDSTLEEHIKKHSIVLNDIRSSYKALVSEEKIIEERDFHNLGTLRLTLIFDPKDKLNRKILVTRSSGMTLFYDQNISRLISFSGVLELIGEDLNTYFKEMETPAHDKWEPKRHQNPKQAKEYRDEVKQWVREIVYKYGENSSDEEIYVEGLSGVLQDEEKIGTEEQQFEESINSKLDGITLSARTTTDAATRGFLFGGESTKANSKSKEQSGRISSEGALSATRKLSGKTKRKKIEKHKGIIEKDGNAIIHVPENDGEPCPLDNVRMIRLNDRIYRASFNVPRDIERGHIEIVTVGENGKSAVVRLENVSNMVGGTILGVNDNKIQFNNLKFNMRTYVDFALFDSRSFAMEVNVFEHNK